MKFVWDSVKAASNLREHKVSFVEASTIFKDDLSATAPDRITHSLKAALLLSDFHQKEDCL